jgi:hypothetical protein
MRCQHCGQWNDSPNVTDQIQIASMLTNEARMAQLRSENERNSYIGYNAVTATAPIYYSPNTCSSGIPQK